MASLFFITHKFIWFKSLLYLIDTFEVLLGSSVVCIDPNGFYPHPTDCQKYFQCGHGTPYELTCPSGTLWNDELDYCDWPANVQCSSGSTNAPSSSASTNSLPTTTTAEATTTTTTEPSPLTSTTQTTSRPIESTTGSPSTTGCNHIHTKCVKTIPNQEQLWVLAIHALGPSVGGQLMSPSVVRF